MTVSPVELAPGMSVGGTGFVFIAGQCVIEDPESTLEGARRIAALAHRLGLSLIFKASFDKANRTSIKSFRGPGLDEGLSVLRAVRDETGLPVTTDVHLPEQCEATAEVCDVLQIPAFLCRQTDLLVEAGKTGRAVTVKKGQFMAPEDMRYAVEKVANAGNSRIAVIERGAAFGYRNLVVDMRVFPVLHDLGIPVIYDATHSLQLPGAGEGSTAGERRFAEPLARAAVAAGADGLFMEVHPDPDSAKSDASTQLSIDRAEALAVSLLELRRTLAASVPLA